MKTQILAYATAMANMYDRAQGLISTADVTDHLNDLIDFITDIPDEQVIEITYDPNAGSDGMDELNN